MLSIDAQGFLRRVEDKNVLATNWYHKQEILEVTHFLKVNEHEMEVLTNYKRPTRSSAIACRNGRERGDYYPRKLWLFDLYQQQLSMKFQLINLLN